MAKKHPLAAPKPKQGRALTKKATKNGYAPGHNKYGHAPAPAATYGSGVAKRPATRRGNPPGFGTKKD